MWKGKSSLGAISFLVVITQLAGVRSLIGQPGAVDPDFYSGTGIGTDQNPDIRCLAEQSDGKVLFGGSFTRYQGVTQPYLGRSRPDGVRDANFNPGVDSVVECITLQQDGKILIGGHFRNVGAVSRQRVARLDSDGFLDWDFDPGSGANSIVYSIVIQPGGKLVIGGSFTNFNGTSCHGIVRLNSNGSLDPSFNVSVEPLGYQMRAGVESIIPQPDGKLLLLGSFTTVNGIGRTNLARLHADGSLDLAFDAGTNLLFVSRPNLALQNGALIIVPFGGDIIRLNSHGGFDPAFNGNRGQMDLDGSIDTLAVQSDGKIVVGGHFWKIAGFPRTNVARLNSDGTFDWSFHPGAGADASVLAAFVQRDDRILIGGKFSRVHDVPRRGIARLLAGDLPPTPPTIITEPLGATVREGQPVTFVLDGVSFETPTIEWRQNGATIAGETNPVFRINFAQFRDAGDYTALLRNSAGMATSAGRGLERRTISDRPRRGGHPLYSSTRCLRECLGA